MKNVPRTIGALITLGVLGLALSSNALAQDASPTASQEKVQFVAGTTNAMRTVNPFNAIEAPEYEALSLNYDLLINFGKEDLYNLEPGLATEWTRSDDGLSWSIKVRDDMTWHDGVPFTAKDVVFTYNVIVDEGLGSFSNYFPHPAENAFELVDDYTFRWNTTEPTWAPTYPPWVYILPEHIWGDFTKKEISEFRNFLPNDPERSMVGTGPFRLTEWEKGQSWSFTAQEGHYFGDPKIDEYIVRQFDNEEAMVQALKAGEIDYINSSNASLFNSLRDQEDQGITTHVGPQVTFTSISVASCDPTAADAPGYCEKVGSTGHPALFDPVVRDAIAMSIDRQSLVDRVLLGYGSPGNSVVPPYASQWHWDPGDQTIPFDIEGAKQSLEQAGYVDTDGDGIREMPPGSADPGRPLEFRLVLRTESPNSPKYGRLIAGWLDQVGIGTKTESVTDNKLISLWLDNDFDLYIWGWAPDPDPDFILSTFTSAQCGYWSSACYFNPDYDKMYKEQQVAPTVEERQAIINQMQDIVYQNQPEIVLYYDKYLEAYRSDRWEGFFNSPAPDGILWAQYTPYSAFTVGPVTEEAGTTASSSGGGIPVGVWIGIGLVVAVIVVVALMRRGRDEEDEA